MLNIAKIFFTLCSFKFIYSSPLLDDNQCAGIPYENLCVKLGSKFYLIDANSKLNWFEADRFCRRQHAHLLTIESANEANLISQYFLSKNYDKGSGSDQWFWISGNDLGSEGIFYSITNGMLLPFTNWTPGQPDNAGGNENCVHLWKRSNVVGMNDVNCDRKIHFICELESSCAPLIDLRHDWIINNNNNSLDNNP